MFVIWNLLFLVAPLQFSESRDDGGTRKPPTLNNSSLSVILGDQCVTRDEVREVIREELEMVIMSIQNNTARMLQFLSPGLTVTNPASSCKDIPQGHPSDYYWIQPNDTSQPRQLYCDMKRRCCNTTGGWMRVANLDMTDPNQQCPLEFRHVSFPRRSCNGTVPGCTSVTYPVHSVKYSRVCGRVIGYQKVSTDAFLAYIYRGQTTIDSYYVDGVSLTHGYSPRKHIWTFAAAVDETRSDWSTCPCTRPDLSYTPPVPPFVGNDYFCETGSRNNFQSHRFYHEDPLWNGQGCGSRSTCCTFNNPPWFCKRLSQPTTDNIELRLCKDENYDNEDVSLELVEICIL